MLETKLQRKLFQKALLRKLNNKINHDIQSNKDVVIYSKKQGNEKCYK